MTRYLHSLSAVFFYVLAGTFFLAYILLHNTIASREAAIFLYVGQLPLLASALLYGALSVYRSLHGEKTGGGVLPVVIGLPPALFFLFALFLRIKP